MSLFPGQLSGIRGGKGLWGHPEKTGGLGGHTGSHASLHTAVIPPDPIDFRIPAFKKSRAASMLDHPYEGELAFSTSNGFENQKYRLLRTLAKSEVGYCTILHSCFASSARLKLCKSRKPSPPLSRDVHILSHAIQ
ncbi:unnamed protein product [Microthlaspi erraticum]|uniref:Uncharacterized protein n=1 Tax=Microthlaspi erraticum TaxID=1685480 RepID=A0A6D2JAN6_9BRAS|nr:unnamed protein product [Microthlaspi erraticum]